MSIPLVAIELLTASRASEENNVRQLIQLICPWPFVRLHYPSRDCTPGSISLRGNAWSGLWVLIASTYGPRQDSECDVRIYALRAIENFLASAIAARSESY